MRKFWILGVMLSLSFSAQAIKTEDFITVTEGNVKTEGIMADDDGKVFVEFTKNTHVIVNESKEKYEGNILPPEMIEIADSPPRHRMKELVSFELIGQIPGTLKFVDPVELMHPKERRRFRYLNPNAAGYNPVNLYIPLKADLTFIALWQYKSSEESWHRVGGKLTPSEDDPETQVFSAILKSTGAYTLFNENPDPTGTDPYSPEAFEPAEESPFPSVITTPEIEEDLFAEEDFENLEDDTIIPALEDTLPEIEAPQPLLTTPEDGFVPAAPEEPDVLYEDESVEDDRIEENVFVEEIPEAAPVTASVPEGNLPQSGATEIKFNPLWVFLGTVLLIGFAAFYRPKEELDV